MAEDLQYWSREGDVWGATNPLMSRPCQAAALPVICDANNWRFDEQMNDHPSDGGAFTIDPTSCFNLPVFDLLPSAHGTWSDQDLFIRTIGRSHSVMIQEEEEVNPKRYKLNQETTSAWSPNNFSGSISPSKESTIDEDVFGDRRPWNSPKIEPTSMGVLCNNTLGPSAAFSRSLQSVDDHSYFIASREQIGLLSSLVEERSHRKACPGDSLCVMDDEYLLRKVRMETSSPLPTFKMRKEKLGDRVTALQQLVSPFGKTDTASVLNEAVQYIKFLHNQIRAFCCPYMKNHDILQHQQGQDQSKDGNRYDLRSRGLCLVPISSTTPVDSHEIASDSAWPAPFAKSLNYEEGVPSQI